MRCTIAGAGPAGLSAGIALKRIVGRHCEVTIFDDNLKAETAGYGVIVNPISLARCAGRGFRWPAAISAHVEQWNDIRVWAGVGQQALAQGHPSRAVQRSAILHEMRNEAVSLGVELVPMAWQEPPPGARPAELVIDARGAGHRPTGRPKTDTSGGSELNAQPNASASGDPGPMHFAWFGTDRVLESLTFAFAESGRSLFTAHAYPYGPDRSSFIVEASAQAWQAELGAWQAELGAEAPSAAAAAGAVRQLCERLFVDVLQGRPLAGNGVLRTFVPHRSQSWTTPGGAVLIGDRAHAAHFSVGSGTTMAIDDGVALADQLVEQSAAKQPVSAAIESYTELRLRETDRIQALATRSFRWLASVPMRRRYLSVPELTWSLVTRTGQGSVAKLRYHDPKLHEALTACGRDRPRPEPGPVRELPLQACLEAPDLFAGAGQPALRITAEQLTSGSKLSLIDLLESRFEQRVLSGQQHVELALTASDLDWGQAQVLAGRASSVTAANGVDQR
jgi:anthraniloyl-CoA monooxygenase